MNELAPIACPVCHRPLAEWFAKDTSRWVISCNRAKETDHQFYVERKRRCDTRRIARRVAP